MAGKTLSNGTMSLRFMQNASRAKLQAQVELEQAKIKDDAEWSVSQEIRDAWGLGQSASAGSSTDVVYEASYVPFIFQSDAGEASSSSHQEERPKLRGRRTFNARGEEVVQEEKIQQQQDEQAAADTTEQKPSFGSRFEKRPTSISGFKVSIPKDGKKTRTKTAQELIREDISARPPASMQPPPPPRPVIKSEEGFVKPAGVDEPVRTARKAPRSESRVKRERSQDGGTDRPGLEGKKRKK
ncbi:uncharacterized protein TRAVEDRAFT_99221, partial [Trametes versicolor FP-101664 SS1]|uniref:uncharacterized protein n=1 Tax=Trametes versicolor (strain FP-101664) TaxID=717944 RepID=UPI0004622634